MGHLGLPKNGVSADLQSIVGGVRGHNGHMIGFRDSLIQRR